METDLTKIYSGVTARKADLILLVLASQGITAWTERSRSHFDILVRTADSTKALADMQAYYRENRWTRIKHQAEQVSLSSFSSPAAFCLMGVLCFIHWAGFSFNLHDLFIMRCGASALYILQGETYRATTALLLHADLQHLMGNLAGILIFTAPFLKISGYGTGLFCLLFCSTSANLINAHLHQTAHLSIGASTLVMASAGLLCAFQVLRKNKRRRLKTIMPIFAGAVLVVLLSQGERTDVWAHVLGFLCGLVAGFIFLPVNPLFKSRFKHPIFSGIALLVILLCLASAFGPLIRIHQWS